MIASLTGTVASVGESYAVIDVNGVGYAVQGGSGTLANLKIGSNVVLHVSTIVREDSITLHGFNSATERDLFELLQTAQKIGPRIARDAIDSLRPDVIRRAIATGDTATLSRIPGVGKKSAERIVLDLADKIGPVEPGLPHQAGSRPGGWRVQVGQGLQALGWSAKEAETAIEKLDAEGADGQDVPTLLKQAIRLLGKR
ncbi:Holliday junction branch migration protein RuvA [Glycomyces buryatensis]|uniref:Holliday junction branch migration complex subunit RuvA n=1 Tax=Glycomyces buryatensis TaxID=2570927 RepID=A0A4S8PZ74_9ACTN|nr:Holliday junction branch migration protein RuvA [Glycomyces buryatensis]THV37043.1 Holliday junction branch migration protein RuvA [Glycomyces buryatensis]